MADDWDPFADPAADAPPAEVPAATEEAAAPAAIEVVESAKPGPEIEVEIRDGIKGLSTLPPKGKVQLLVLMLGGNPEPSFGSATMRLPILEECAKALEAKGLFHLRFDYAPYGASAGACTKQELASGQKSTPLELDMKRDIVTVGRWAAQRCDALIVLGYSGGINCCLRTYSDWSKGKVKYMFAVSPGQEVWKWIGTFGDLMTPEKEIIKKDMYDTHIEATLPIKYIVGSKDKMTPLAGLKTLLMKRSDFFENVEVQTVEGGDHSMKGKEEEVAALAAEWLAERAARLQSGPAESM